MIAGDVVLLNFPFSDLSGAKLRPAVVLAAINRDEFIACQITSKHRNARVEIELNSSSFAVGDLRMTSFSLPGRLFTGHRRIVVKRVARVRSLVLNEIREAAVAAIRGR